MVDLKYDHITRQLDILKPDALHEQITIVGAGAIGSFTALLLAKSGFQDITVYDFDSVSIENMNNQFYRLKDIGKPKVIALHELIKDFTDVDIVAAQGKFTAENMRGLKGTLITAVDSMAVRREILDNFCYSGLRLVIDPRMSAEFLTMQTYDSTRLQAYEKSLVDDKDAVQEACTAKSTAYTASLAAGYVMKTVKNHVMGEQVPKTMFWDIKSVSRPAVF